MPAHNHRVQGNTNNDGTHVHNLATANGQGNLEWGYNFTYDNWSAAGNYGAFMPVSGAHTHAINFISGNTGGGTAANNMQPYIVLNYIIKFK